MLSKSAAKMFFLVGTGLCSTAFLMLTMDTVRQVPGRTREENLTAEVARGKHLWEANNCMGCHTLFGEGAYYAPELTRVYQRRGPEFIRALIRDPQAMYPGERRMVKYDFSEADLGALVAFFKWVGEVDLNDWPPKPDLGPQQAPAPAGPALAGHSAERPPVFTQMCTACHSLGGQGGQVGPPLDAVGERKSREELVAWLTDPQAVKPDARMPRLPLSTQDIDALAAFLSLKKSGGTP